jgi:tetratricopeptide (TPR) repeat protein
MIRGQSVLRGLLLAVAFAPGLAHAVEMAKNDQAPPAASADPDVEKAREHLRKASVHYDLQEFRKALAEFREAYRLKNDPVILFDMGQCNRKMAHYREAIDFYKSYLRKVPSGNNRAEAERLIAESEKALKESPPEPSAPAPGAEKEPEKPADKTPPATGGLGTETMPLGHTMRRHRRGRLHPDAGASAADPAEK